MDSRKKEYDEINRRYEESGLSLKKFAEREGISPWKAAYARRYSLAHTEAGGFVEVTKDRKIELKIGKVPVIIDRDDLLSLLRDLL